MSLRVEVGRLLRRPGQRRDVSGRYIVAELRLANAHVPDGAVDLDLEIEGVSGDELVMTGTAAATWQVECRRCLDPVLLPTTLELREVFIRDRVEGETYPLAADDTIDLEPVIREALILVVPVAPLCGPDCSGPEPERFPTGPADETDAGPDPRWAALDELTFE